MTWITFKAVANKTKPQKSPRSRVSLVDAMNHKSDVDAYMHRDSTAHISMSEVHKYSSDLKIHKVAIKKRYFFKSILFSKSSNSKSLAMSQSSSQDLQAPCEKAQLTNPLTEAVKQSVAQEARKWI